MTPEDRLLRDLAVLRLAAPRAARDRVLAELDAQRERLVAALSHLGPVWVTYNERGISHLLLAEAGEDEASASVRVARELKRPVAVGERPPRGLGPALRSGDGRGLTYDLDALTPFARAVLDATLEIPAGETRAYAWVARRIGRPRAVRAVGTALAQNPVPLLIPCHRVVRSDGSTGQYGLGPEKKRALLELEGALLPH